MIRHVKKVALVAGFAIMTLVATDASAALSPYARNRKRPPAPTVKIPQTPIPHTPDSNPVPEPASLALMGSALAGLGGYRGLRKKLARR